MTNVLEKSVVVIGENSVGILDDDATYDQYIQEKLAEAEEYAARPDAKWYTWEEVRGMIRERHGI
jgi:hypothetical protein